MVDEKRHLFYALSENAVIHVFVLTANGNANGGFVPQFVCQRRLFEEATRCTGRSHGLPFDKESFRGIGIFVVPSRGQDVRDVALVAVTNRGAFRGL